MRSFGRYRLVEPLASGGMADVWRAETTLAEGVVKQVALKLVRGEHGARSDFVRMFVEEARLASRLGHANVVQVLDFDQVDGRYYIAMELVRGHDLGRVVERCRDRGVRLGLARAVHAGAEVAKALAYAHRLADGGAPLGVVHRDVSPHNVLVSYEGEVKLADFGIARAMGQAGLTAPGTLKGKLAYMAPEQARGEPLDARADVFALGVVLWELCAGRRLFARDTDAATLAAVLDGPPPSPPSAWNEEVPPELDAAILGALERDRVRRTGSAQELATALAGILLRVTRTPDDADLRALMQRLWPVEERVAAARADATRVRPVPGAAEPLEGAVPPAPAETRVAPPPAGRGVRDAHRGEAARRQRPDRARDRHRRTPRRDRGERRDLDLARGEGERPQRDLRLDLDLGASGRSSRAPRRGSGQAPRRSVSGGAESRGTHSPAAHARRSLPRPPRPARPDDLRHSRAGRRDGRGGARGERAALGLRVAERCSPR